MRYLSVSFNFKAFIIGIIDFQDDYNEITETWKAKQKRGAAGEQIWGLFIAKKK